MIEPAPSQETILRAMRVSEFEYTSEVWWRTDDEGALRIFVNCSDVFAWGGSDLEEITDDNIELLESCVAECESLLGRWNGEDGFLLFVARLRNMRPQGAYYKHIAEELHPLFHAAGPERTVGLSNPAHAPAVTV